MRYFLQRFLQLLLVFFIVTFTVLVVMRIGSPDAKTLAIKLAGKPLTDAEQADLISRYSLDSNFFSQYLTWLKQLIFHFDLGESPQNSSTVADLLKPRVWTTVLLGLYAIIFGLIVAVPIAVWQAYRRDRPFDKFASVATFVAVGIPGIVLGLFLKLGFVVHWNIFPSIGDKVYPWDNFGDHVMNFFLPTVTLMIPVAAIYARLLRADMVLTLQSDFVTLASAKGVPPAAGALETRVAQLVVLAAHGRGHSARRPRGQRCAGGIAVRPRRPRLATGGVGAVERSVHGAELRGGHRAHRGAGEPARRPLVRTDRPPYPPSPSTGVTT